MYKTLKYISISILLFLTVIVLGRLTCNKININFSDNKLKCSIVLKGTRNSRDITTDEKGDLYVAYKDRIQFLDGKGKSYDIIKNKEYDISSIDQYDNKLYFASKDKVYCFDLSDKKISILVKGLPNFGDYNKSNILVQNGSLYISIGAVTNSGVVGNDNSWVKENPFYWDLSPFDVVLKGINFGQSNTGAFVPFGTQNRNSQIISAHFPGNSSLVVYSLHNGKMETFAWGIRNIKSMDTNSKGKIIASIGGIEDRGSRPLKGDTDYIYQIDKGVWYGWPDFSGGDPVTSPRFKGNGGNTEMILQSPPNLNPPAPIYQHKEINSIISLAVDKGGILGEKDGIYFYDNRDNIVYRLNASGTISPYITLGKRSNICQIKFLNSKLVILDKGTGYVYTIDKK